MDASSEARYFDLNIEKFLESWEVKHAIRELIANALDEETLTKTAAVEISKFEAGSWRIRDYGRGVRYEHLTQKENKEKLRHADKMIGRFGVGLKDALATLHRRGVSILLRSAHGSISLVNAQKHGFDDITTLHAHVFPTHDRTMKGTEIILRNVMDVDIQAAMNFFMRFSGEGVVETTSLGQVLKRVPKKNARIYVNGLMVAEEEKFLFSYNITSLTASMRKALNRERTNVGRTAYADRVKALLLAAKSNAVADELVQDLSCIEKGTSHDEVQWTDVSLHACKLLNASKKVLFVSAFELMYSKEAVDRARSEGFEMIVIPETIRRRLRGMLDLDGKPVRDLDVYNTEWIKSFEFKFIPEASLTAEEQAIFSCHTWIEGLVGGMPKQVKKLLLTESMRPELEGTRAFEPVGLWEPHEGRIIIKRCQLKNLRAFAGTLIHEIVHARSGHSDVTREFETCLTDALGELVAKMAVAEPPPLSKPKGMR